MIFSLTSKPVIPKPLRRELFRLKLIGEELWKFQTGTGIVSSPITWEQDGEQYLTIVTGWGGAVPLWGGEVAKFVSYLNQGGSVWTFKIPEQLASK